MKINWFHNGKQMVSREAVLEILEDLCVECATDLPVRILRDKTIDWQDGWEASSEKWEKLRAKCLVKIIKL